MRLLDIICKELGVEVGEEWLGDDGYYYKIDEDGYLLTSCADDSGLNEYVWEAVSTSIPRLLREELKPVWRPKYGETYYYPSVDVVDRYSCTSWEDFELDYYRLEKGLIFKTKEEAVECAKKMLEAIEGGRLNE